MEYKSGQTKYDQNLAHQKNLIEEIEQEQKQQQIEELVELEQKGMISEKQLDQLYVLQNKQLEKQRMNKQMYLRREVLEKGYDAQSFMQYLSSIKQDGQNIDCWQQQELENIVKQFIEQQQSQLDTQNQLYLHDQINQNMDDYEQSELPVSSINDKNEVSDTDNQEDEQDSQIVTANKIESHQGFVKDCFTEKRVSVIDNEYDEILECKKLKDIQNLKEIEVDIIDSQVRQGGIFNFGRSYTIYKLESTFINNKNEVVRKSEVFRRFKEFKWLRQVLKVLYPGRYVATLFKKKTNKTTSLKKEKRKIYLQQFISDIVNNPDFLECPYLLAFLQKDSDSEFQQIIKRGKGLKEIRDLKNIVNTNGSLYSSINASNRQLIECFNDYVGQAEPIYNKIKKLSKQLMVDLDNISMTYFEIGDCYKQLFDITNYVSNTQREQKFSKLNETYLRLNNLAVNWGNQYISKIRILQDNFYSQLKYSCREFDSYRELLKVRNDYANQYASSKIKLNKKKDKVFNETYSSSKKKDPDNDEFLQQKEKAFQDILPQETKKLEELKKQFGYYNNYCYDDLCRQLFLKQKIYETRFCNINQQFLEMNSEMDECWDDLAEFFNRKSNMDSNCQRDVINDLSQRTKQRVSMFKCQSQEDDEDY